VRGTDVVTASHDEECDDEQTSKTGDRLRPFQVVHVAASLFSVRDGGDGVQTGCRTSASIDCGRLPTMEALARQRWRAGDGAFGPQVWWHHRI